MKDAQVIDILYIAFTKIEPHSELFCEKMYGVEGFCLCLCDGGDIRRAWKGLEASEIAPCVLDYNSLGGFVGGFLVVEKWTRDVALIVESAIFFHNLAYIYVGVCMDYFEGFYFFPLF